MDMKLSNALCYRHSKRASTILTMSGYSMAGTATTGGPEPPPLATAQHY